MRATHTDYLHPGCLRVVTGEKHLAWNVGEGWHHKDALCVSPSSSEHARLNKPTLPKWSIPNGR